MTINLATAREPQTSDCVSRKSGLDFDQNGHRSTLGEMTQMGGFFPLNEVADRLPFRVGTFKKWARKGPFTSCFRRVQAGNATLLLIHLSQFSDRFEELAEQGREEDSGGAPACCDPAMYDVSDLHEFAKLVIQGNHL